MLTGARLTDEQRAYIGREVTCLAGVVYTVRGVYVSPHPIRRFRFVELALSPPGQTAPTSAHSFPPDLVSRWIAGEVRCRVHRPEKARCPACLFYLTAKGRCPNYGGRCGHRPAK